MIRFKPKPDSPFTMSATQVADWWLDLHSMWFEEMHNSLYEKRHECGKVIVDFLLGFWPARLSESQEYVLMKFREDAANWFERVAE